MPTPVTNNPQFHDGDQAITDGYVRCLNNGIDYLYADDGIGETAMHTEFNAPSGEGLGSHTQATGRYKGPLSLQLVSKDDAMPRPSYVFLFRGKYYGIIGDIGETKKKNDVVRIKPTVGQIINPLITNLLSVDGQYLTHTATNASNPTIANVGANFRAGSSKAWSLLAWTEEFPAAVVPAGCVINAGTGEITCTAVGAGTYYLKVRVVETLANKPPRTGVGFLILILT